MKAALRSLYRIFCLLLVAIGFFVGLFAFCGVFVMGIVWFQEGKLLPDDRQMLARAATWFGGACLFVFVTWRLAALTGKSDESFRLRKTSPKADQRGQHFSFFVLFLMVAAALWAALPGPPALRVVTLAGWLILFFLGLHVQIFLHELGHCAAAWLMKFDLRKMQIGTGASLWSCSFSNGFRFEWRAWSLGGFMMANDPATTNFRIRRLAFVAAGPLTDLIIVWVGYRLIFCGGFSSAFLESAGRIPVYVFIWTLLSALAGLIPRTAWLGDRNVWTDGYWLWLLVTASNERLASLAAKIRWSGTFESFRPGDRPPWFEWTPVPSAPTSPAASLKTFRRQHLRLSSDLLRRPKP